MTVERETRIAASPDDVYAVVMDPERLEDWVTIHDALIEAPNGRLEKGSKLTQRLKLAGRSFTVEWTVVENERPRHVVWAGHGPMRSKASVTYELTAENGGTRFSYANDYDLPGGPLGRMAGPLIGRVTAREIDRSLERLKHLLE